MSLAKEINRIRSECAEIGSKMMWGKSCAELFKEVIEKALADWDKEVSFPPDSDEMGSNGFRG